MSEATPCEEKIGKRLQDRLEELVSDINNWDRDTCLDHLDAQGRDPTDRDDLELLREECREARADASEPLAITESRTFRIELSFGGPSDGFELDWQDGNWVGGRYYYQEWYDGAECEINASQAQALANLWHIHEPFNL